MEPLVTGFTLEPQRHDSREEHGSTCVTDGDVSVTNRTHPHAPLVNRGGNASGDEVKMLQCKINLVGGQAPI